MSKLTYRDIPLVQSAGGEVTSSGTAWWLTDKHGTRWYVTESEDNQYLLFNDFKARVGIDRVSPTMEREQFAELFE